MKIFPVLLLTLPLALTIGCTEPRYHSDAGGTVIGSHPGYYDAYPHHHGARHRADREWLPPTAANDRYPYRYETRHYAERPAVIVQRGMRGESSRADNLLARRIRHGFEMNRELSGSLRNVTINVHEGRVTVSGTAASEREAREIIRELRQTPGVIQIRDRLKIQRQHH